jgi:hypothetical protein
MPRKSEKLATNPVRELRGSVFAARAWGGEVVPASFAIGIVLDVFIRTIGLAPTQEKHPAYQTLEPSLNGSAGTSTSEITTCELDKVFLDSAETALGKLCPRAGQTAARGLFEM